MRSGSEASFSWNMQGYRVWGVFYLILFRLFIWYQIDEGERSYSNQWNLSSLDWGVGCTNWPMVDSTVHTLQDLGTWAISFISHDNLECYNAQDPTKDYWSISQICSLEVKRCTWLSLLSFSNPNIRTRRRSQALDELEIEQRSINSNLARFIYASKCIE